MKLIAADKTSGMYVANPGFTGQIATARSFHSVAEAKQYCLDNGVPEYQVIAYVPGAVAANTIIVAESGNATPNQPGKPRFD